jgi:hypothetical protein
MKINPDHEQFVQDLVLRITSNANFNPENGNIDKACKQRIRSRPRLLPAVGRRARRAGGRRADPSNQSRGQEGRRRETEDRREARRQEEGQQSLIGNRVARRKRPRNQTHL